MSQSQDLDDFKQELVASVAKLLKPLHDQINKLQKQISELQSDVDLLTNQVRSSWKSY